MNELHSAARSIRHILASTYQPRSRQNQAEEQFGTRLLSDQTNRAASGGLIENALQDAIPRLGVQSRHLVDRIYDESIWL